MLFDWDKANSAHILEHGIAPDEAEYALTHNPLDVDVQVRESEERVLQVGATRKGRIITVVTTVRGNLVRVVTAFDASRNRRKEYEARRKEHHGTPN